MRRLELDGDEEEPAEYAAGDSDEELDVDGVSQFDKRTVATLVQALAAMPENTTRAYKNKQIEYMVRAGRAFSGRRTCCTSTQVLLAAHSADLCQSQWGRLEGQCHDGSGISPSRLQCWLSALKWSWVPRT